MADITPSIRKGDINDKELSTCEQAYGGEYTDNRSSHRRCFIKKVFLQILQNSQENTSVCENFKNTFPKKQL